MGEEKAAKGIDYFNLALLSFAGLGFELIILTLEQFIYQQPVDFKNWTVISHWAITCIVWIITIIFIIKHAHNKYGFKLTQKSCKMSKLQWILLVAIIIFSLMISYKSWDGFKVIKEYKNLGTLRFIMQYIYYFVETILITLIIVFGQKAFEKIFKNARIPYGGIICAITWGLGHVFTKSSLQIGLLSALSGFLFGAVYLLVNRDFLKTILILFLIFII